MECPVCKEQLAHVWKGDILVDLCPNCKGAWVERGELEKALALLSGEGARSFRATENAREHDGIDEDRRYRRNDGHDSDGDDDDDRRRYGQRSGEHGGRRKRGVFGNIMDMFG